MSALTILLTIGLIIPACLYGQTDPIDEDTDIRPFTAGGSISMTGQVYSASGIANRRAPTKANLNVSTDFSLFGLQSGLNIFYSTDQSRLRQNMNDISFNGSYKWFSLRAGDVSPGYSSYGLGDATLRGGSAEITPGNFQLKTSIGRSQRAVRPGTTSTSRAAFERWIYAGKIGVGGDDGTHFHLSTMYAQDNLDSIDGANLQISPKKNLTITPDAGLTIVPEHLTMNTEVTFSALNRDRTSQKLDLSESALPSFISTVFQPRTSSRFNYAGKVNLNMQLNRLSLGLGYNRVQPGFRSLGKNQVRDDYRSIQVSPAFSLVEGKVNVNSSLSFGRNNLLGDRFSTRKTRNYMVNVQTQFTPMIMLNTSYNHNLNKSIPTSDTLASAADQRHASDNLQLQPTFTLRSGQTTHNISLTFSWLQSKSRLGSGGLQTSRDFTNTTLTNAASYSLTLPSGLSLNGNVNYLVNDSRNITNRSLGLTGGGSYAFFQNSLRISLNTSINQNITESSTTADQKLRQFSLNLNANYQLTSNDTFKLSLQNRSNVTVTGNRADYSEFQGQLQYSHQF